MKIHIDISAIAISVISDNNNNTLYSYRAKDILVMGDIKAITNEIKNLITEATEKSE